MCACYGGLTVGLDSRLPASCRGSSGEADYAKPDDLDSGPQVSFNLLLGKNGKPLTSPVRVILRFE